MIEAVWSFIWELRSILGLSVFSMTVVVCRWLDIKWDSSLAELKQLGFNPAHSKWTSVWGLFQPNHAAVSAIKHSNLMKMVLRIPTEGQAGKFDTKLSDILPNPLPSDIGLAKRDLYDAMEQLRLLVSKISALNRYRPEMYAGDTEMSPDPKDHLHGLLITDPRPESGTGTLANNQDCWVCWNVAFNTLEQDIDNLLKAKPLVGVNRGPILPFNVEVTKED